jgi:uncharacterized cysteine cluster protein YcgN (CxxCxxCC family)
MLAGMSDKRSGTTWEQQCLRCGTCCFEKIEDENGRIFFTQTPCRYLDIHSRECRIYRRRFTVNPECVKLTPELVKTLPWLHDECGYVRDLPPEEKPSQRRRKRRS